MRQDSSIAALPQSTLRSHGTKPGDDVCGYSVSEVRIISISSINLVLRSALLRASRRTATGEIVPVSILRDAVLRTAPQDEVDPSRFHPVCSDPFHGIDPLF
jgi:hypothetical protein